MPLWFADVGLPFDLSPKVAAFVLPTVLAFFISLILTAALIRLAPYLGLIDQPSNRKVHTHPTPRGGGLAIFAALLLTPAWDFQHSRWILGCLDTDPLLVYSLVPIVVLGVLDDAYSLSWKIRLGTQVAVATFAASHCTDNNQWTVTALIAFWVVAMTNAFNMLDNMDALSAGVALIAASILSLGSAYFDPRLFMEDRIVSWLILIAALAGFLWFNRPPARIFMGDSGSTLLGFFLGLGSARLVFNDRVMYVDDGPTWPLAAILAVFAVPCYDMASVIFLRLKQGRSPFHADKQHLSHRLVERGLSKPAAVGVIYLLASASGATGLVLLLVTTRAAAWLAGGQLVVWWVAFAVVEWRSVRTV